MALNRLDRLKAGRAAALARLLGATAALTLALMDPVMAQTLKASAVSVFNVLYGVVGVVGAIACLITAMNWATGNWLGRDDPKKLFFQALIGTAVAFGVVAIIQFLKDTVGGSASGISNL